MANNRVNSVFKVARYIESCRLSPLGQIATSVVCLQSRQQICGLGHERQASGWSRPGDMATSTGPVDKALLSHKS